MPIEDERTIEIKPLQMIQKEGSREMQLFFSAEMSLKHRPKVSKDGTIFFPEEEKSELREALNHYANLISVSEVCRVDISSPTPSTGFIPETEDEKQFLERTKGLEDKIIAKMMFGGGYIEAVGKDQLLDRKEGLSFMAAANSVKDNVARLHEFVRLFERAFSATSNDLATLLFKFLSQHSHFDYTEDEIKEWLTDKRDGATHADRRNSFVFSIDLIDDIERIHQAAYDVLFNKLEWHNGSITRRQLLEFKMILTREGMTIVRGEIRDYVSISSDRFSKVDISDIDFYAKPPKLPNNWWAKREDKPLVSQTSTFKVVEK